MDEMKATRVAYGEHLAELGKTHEKIVVLDAGLALGVGGTVTYKNNPLKDVLRQTGYRHLVLETDAPFLSPVPHRGRRNESAYIPEVAGFLAQLFAVSPAEIARATQCSVREIFGEQAVN